MDFLSSLLPIIIYFLLIILLIIGIVLGLKLIKSLNKVDLIIDDVNNKVKSLDGLFSVINFTSGKITLFTDLFAEKIHSIVKKFMRNKKREKVEESLESEDNDE